jgi:hypothetical protein
MVPLHTPLVLQRAQEALYVLLLCEKNGDHCRYVVSLGVNVVRKAISRSVMNDDLLHDVRRHARSAIHIFASLLHWQALLEVQNHLFFSSFLLVSQPSFYFSKRNRRIPHELASLSLPRNADGKCPCYVCDQNPRTKECISPNELNQSRWVPRLSLFKTNMPQSHVFLIPQETTSFLPQKSIWRGDGEKPVLCLLRYRILSLYPLFLTPQFHNLLFLTRKATSNLL